MAALDHFSLEAFGGVDDGAPEKVKRYRLALGGFTTGVAVVTTVAGKGHSVGLTVNSFASLSLDPPLILWCLSLDSGLKDHFTRGRPFVVNFLAAGQQDVAMTFATAREDRFKGLETVEGIGGAPILKHSSGFLECETEAVHPGGDHVIIVGKVARFASRNEKPLLFHKGKFEGGN